MISRRDVFHGLLASPLLLNRSDAEVTPDVVKFRPEMEPLVSLIENTPRDKCAEVAVEQLRRGVSYRQLLAALFLAGIRNVNPRPPGFAMHCVFIIHSAHLISLESPADLRLLPLFFALDDFKASQERDAKAKGGDYTMPAMRGDAIWRYSRLTSNRYRSRPRSGRLAVRCTGLGSFWPSSAPNSAIMCAGFAPSSA